MSESVDTIMRLAGAEDDAESFQVALEGTARPGYRPSKRPLEERRGGGAGVASMKDYAKIDRMYARVGVATNALGEVNGVLCDLWKCLDKVKYGADPETGFGEAASKIMAGPLNDVETLVKGVGYALSSRFENAGEKEGLYMPSGLLKMGHRSSTDLDTECLHLRGEIAEALTILKEVGPELDKASPGDLYDVDFDLWKKSWPGFQKIESRVSVLCEAITKLGEKMVSERTYRGGVEMMSDSSEAKTMAHGAALAESHRHATLDDVGSFGLGSRGNDFETLNVKGFGTLALVPMNEDSYEVCPIHKGRLGEVPYGTITAGKIARVRRGHEKLMEAVFAAAVEAAKAAKATETHLDAIGEGMEGSVGKAYFQQVGNDKYWVLGIAANKKGSLKVSLVTHYGDSKKPNKAKQDSYSRFTIGDYKEVPLKDVPKEIRDMWLASGAMKEARENLSEDTEFIVKAKNMGGRYTSDDMRRFGDRNQGRLVQADSAEDAVKMFADKMKINTGYIEAVAATPKLKKDALPLDASNQRFALRVSSSVRADSSTLKKLKKEFGDGFENKANVDAPTGAIARAILASRLGIDTADILESAAAPAQSAVFVAKITIPARRPSVDTDLDKSWADEEAKMASDFELELERRPLKPEMGTKATLKVSKIGFEGKYQKYALKVTVQISGEGVSSDDDDLITALDKRAEAAVDSVVKEGGKAAEVAFGSLIWSHTTIEVP